MYFYYIDITINGDETWFSCGNLPGWIKQKKCKYSLSCNGNICSWTFIFIMTCLFQYIFTLKKIQKDKVSVLLSIKCWHLILIIARGRSRTAATSKMEPFVIIVNGWKSLTIITKRSILDVAAALDPPLMIAEDYLDIWNLQTCLKFGKSKSSLVLLIETSKLLTMKKWTEISCNKNINVTKIWMRSFTMITKWKGMYLWTKKYSIVKKLIARVQMRWNDNLNDWIPYSS